jgi:hypothetical protein
MTIYCDTAEVRAISGIPSSTVSDDDLVSIIEQADREVDAFLAPYGLAGSPSGIPKAASIKLSTASLIEHLTIQQSRGYTAADLSRVDALREQAFKLLEQHVASQSFLPSSKKVYCRRVNG